MIMSKDTSSYSQKFEAINLILDEMKEIGKFKGILFSKRNGVLITENIGKGVDYDEFAAMCASVLESAEGLGKTFGVKKIGKIIAELGEQTLIIVECGNKTLLTFIIEKESKIDLVFENLDKYNRKIINAY